MLAKSLLQDFRSPLRQIVASGEVMQRDTAPQCCNQIQGLTSPESTEMEKLCASQ
jgi:hypothetical protein